MIRFTKCSGGFGLLGIIILAAVIASAAFGGGMYWRETKKQQSLLQMGADAKKRAEELKQAIESRDKQIFGSPTSEDTDVENEIPLYSDLEWVSPKQELDPYHGSWNGSVVYSRETKSDMESEFFRFYDSELKLRGWQKNLLDADSPRGRVSGYMKESDHLFLGVERKNLSAISDRPFTCPCERIYSIWSDANIRFINQTDTSDWKTYRNEKYGFEVKYPKEFTFEERDVEDVNRTPYNNPYKYQFSLLTQLGGERYIAINVTPQSQISNGFSFLNENQVSSLEHLKENLERKVMEQREPFYPDFDRKVAFRDFRTGDALKGIVAVGSGGGLPPDTVYYFYKEPYILWIEGVLLDDMNLHILAEISLSFKFIR